MSYQKLKDIREESGETLDQVSKAVGITPQYYWMIENGKRRLNYELAVKIAGHFGKEPDDIFLDSHLTTC